ncbi:hypothetical protein GPJ56_002238 [Histomonas meleagridis]|uniref:uncharacterized protein n=1 Tax=Histomonas meleagridis TaxID=135588 RepID=UPI0035594913|nr:hypothetical protein GPJ56_002238 [Histomonas meleagridis]KAH0802930.1 hypothetical protein GO595_004437 [Histomonas meleagridis]
MLIQQIDQTNLHKSDLSQITKQYEELQKQVQSQHDKFEKTSEIHQRMKKLQYLKSFHDDQKLIKEIKEIETDARKYINISEPWLLDEIINHGGDDKLESLINLKFRRLEDTIFGLRNQLVREQEALSALPWVCREFGSIRNLIDKYNNALDQIKRLKTRELEISEDELIKRRPLSTCDRQYLYLLIVALQNELIGTRVNLRKALLTVKSSGNINISNLESDDTIENRFDYNELEASYMKLQQELLELKKDYEFAQEQIILQNNLTDEKIPKISEKLKIQLSEANRRLSKYHNNIEDMQKTIEMQTSIMNQYQQQNQILQNQKILLEAKVTQLKSDIQQKSDKLMKANHNIRSLRCLSRIIIEQTLVGYNIQSIDNICNLFIENYKKYDAAACVIQRKWRKLKTNKIDKKMCKKSLDKFPLTNVIAMSAIDVIAGNLKPIEYNQILSLIKKFINDIKENSECAIKNMMKEMVNGHKIIIDQTDLIMSRPRRFQWTQTETFRVDKDIQTERVTRSRNKP